VTPGVCVCVYRIQICVHVQVWQGAVKVSRALQAHKGLKAQVDSLWQAVFFTFFLCWPCQCENSGRGLSSSKNPCDNHISPCCGAYAAGVYSGGKGVYVAGRCVPVRTRHVCTGMPQSTVTVAGALLQQQQQQWGRQKRGRQHVSRGGVHMCNVDPHDV
jgi:hypothetical protein